MPTESHGLELIRRELELTRGELKLISGELTDFRDLVIALIGEIRRIADDKPTSPIDVAASTPSGTEAVHDAAGNVVNVVNPTDLPDQQTSGVGLPPDPPVFGPDTDAEPTDDDADDAEED